ncbi:unnamed protein product [Cylicocyclus nassatus]|uniref:Transmembrane protein n=1 Tax=Cylicocyclus nassatus TaxID=53992 RepID=A0AA36H9N4_CYLNA|nr:unnamed protein product [Cylicocyclus nassatus]
MGPIPETNKGDVAGASTPGFNREEGDASAEQNRKVASGESHPQITPNKSAESSFALEGLGSKPSTESTEKPKQSSTTSKEKESFNPDLDHTQDDQEVEKRSENIVAGLCKTDIYLEGLSIMLIGLALFSFLHKPVVAIMKLVFSVILSISIAFATRMKKARAMAAAEAFMGLAAISDVADILMAIDGNSSYGNSFLIVFTSLIRIAYMVHMFMVVRRMEMIYKEKQLLPIDL